VFDYRFVISDLGLAIVATTATYYSFKARGLFVKDIMERVFSFTAGGFLLLALVSVTDALLRIKYIGFDFPLIGTAGVISTGIALMALIMLIRWAGSTMEPICRP
jgi:hypothetical protein